VRRPIINQTDDLVVEALEGFELTYPGLVRYDRKSGIVARARQGAPKVGLVSGGGSGHEPLHAGFVGIGMLDVAVPGAVFASPTALQVHQGTLAASTGRGVLQIVKNYTGDVLNFQIAGELAADDTIKTEVVLVDDDLATESEDGGPGRRGTAAVIAVEKICGASAEAGADLHEVAWLGRRISANARTMAFALRAGTYPGHDGPAFTLGPSEVELGVGIHGERGISRAALKDADGLTALIVDPLLSDLGLTSGESVIAIVNGLGSTHALELSIVARALHRQLTGRRITIERSLVGNYVTSLDMHGVSITLLRADDDLVRLWDAPVRTPALTW
jgi:phosphoenolpyruvate---glycerone phosphotransferase subunit DhaK